LTELKLPEIIKPIENELKVFHSKFSSTMRSDVKIVDYVTKYIIRQKGKRIRPILVLLSAKALGGINEQTYVGATLVELLHTATLVHDDVVDEAQKRRGLPSINNIWKNKVGVLIGDYLLARGLMIAVDNESFSFLKQITTTVKRMSEGELLQISKTKRLNINEETYFKIIQDKTASLLETCTIIGAESSSDNSEYISALHTYGNKLGIAFQIQDDILDFVGKSKLFGKTIGGDIKEKKLTLPLIHALAAVESNKKKEILTAIRKRKDPAMIKQVVQFVKDNGGIDYAQDVANRYVNEAISALDILPDTPAKTSLKELVHFVVGRDK
jgi:octaprenyl-diphosphate synthase